MSEALDLPQVYRHHVFACFQQRPPQHPRGSCGQAGAQPLWQRLQQRMEGKPDMAMVATGCLGFCRAGPLMVVYPQGIWYAPRTPEDVDEIVDLHLLGGTPVERLIILPQP
ncbi:(2Fe-2S) ferredoxin domain-containing protein [Paracraurococcus lichenis]|uniref:(2Fe-2S) ferredoxin domain-containing protein n=1 Tax=Paracraurococcus lichenis TaxID=3064888 RepID=A0ABT9E2Q1_9PROT|nr:(2Fe-2S) ferredoxin domain-containing protein [Paracraurococcus sp. LOR1-02]MDO9710280.1 (2Fe-2S) ferredoxin domain-containing protein [Paracraurococcus sp. LOR1-02]